MSVEFLNSTDSRVEVFKKVNKAIERTDDATPENVGVMRIASETDETNCSCNNAAITPSNLYDLNNFRKANTGYAVGDTVGCAYHNDLQLKCIFAGITENSGIDTSGKLKKGQTIQDGTVVWTVEEIGTGSGSGHSLFDIVLKDHILTYDEAEGFELLGTYVYKEAVAGSRYGYPTFYEQCLKEYQEAVADGIYFKHANGHVFYDIANKAEVDAVYNSTGIAWAYGIDTANERIFLPRNDYYFKNGSAEDVGKYIEQELPNIKGSFNASLMTSGLAQSTSGAVSATQKSTNAKGGTGHTFTEYQIDINASKSNSTYKDGGEVIPKSVSMIAYMVVGNTANEEALTDVIDITTTENDTLPLFYNTYSQQDMTGTGAFVNASLGNYLDGNVWTTAYAEIERMGIGAKFDAGTIKAYGDSSITDYDLVLNQSNMTFRLPLLNGDRVLVEATSTLKLYNDGWCWQRGSATAPSTANTWGTTITLNRPYTSNGYTIYLTNHGNTSSSGALKFKDETKAVGSFEVCSTVQSTAFLWITEGYVEVPTNTGVNLYYKLDNVVQNAQLLDVAGVTSALNKKVSADNLVEAHVIVETYVNGTSWYRVYSDGWCEQGGTITAATNISLLKSFKDTNYTAVTSTNTVYTKSTTNLNITDLNHGVSNKPTICGWMACGYIS